MSAGARGTGRDPRVVWVSTDLGTRGGVSSAVRALAATPLRDRWRVRHVSTHRDGTAAGKVAAFARGAATLAVVLARREADLLHVHTSTHGSFVRKAIVLWAARARRVPVVLHVHGSDFDVWHDAAPPPVRAVIRATLGAADAVVALGRRWAGRLEAIAPHARVVVVPNAVPVAADGGAGAERVAGDPVRVVFLGAIGARKGAFVLLEAWALVTRTGPPARLVVAGDGEVDRARAAVERLGVGATAEVRTWVPQDEVRSLLAAADVLVLPSLREGQPMAVLEAMAAGVCVVASTAGGIPELLDDGAAGVLVPPGDVPALADALRAVLADPQRRRDLGAAGQRRAAAVYSTDAVWRRFDELYREVLGAR